MCIPGAATAGEKEAAEKFINFILDPEIGALLAEINYSAGPNAATEELLDEEFLSDPTIYHPADVLSKLQYPEPLGEFVSEYQRLWDEIKSGAGPKQFRKS